MKSWLWILVGLGMLFFLLILGMGVANDTPEGRKQMSEEMAIDKCRRDHRDATEEYEKQFLSAACATMEAQYQKDYGHAR